jgi:hypothetical protein
MVDPTKERTMGKQYIYQAGSEYYLVEVYEDKVTLMVKRNGWSDIWSRPLELVKESE